MKNFLITLTLLSIISAGCTKQNISPANPAASPLPQYNYTHRLKVGGQNLMVEISTTTAQMEQGLSDRVSMDDNQGMLFDFSATPNSTPFWMKDMKFNLDFIWIADGKVVGVTSDAQAPVGNRKLEIENLPLYYPPEPVNQVLEVNAGWAEKNKIKTGSEVRFVK